MTDKAIRMSKDSPRVDSTPKNLEELGKIREREETEKLEKMLVKLRNSQIEQLQEELPPNAEEVSDLGIEFKEGGGYYLYIERNGEKKYFGLKNEQFRKLAEMIKQFTRAKSPGYYEPDEGYYPYEKYPYQTHLGSEKGTSKKQSLKGGD